MLACYLQAEAKSLDFIIDTAAGDHPFDPYMSLLKTGGVLVLVGFPSEVKFHPASLNIGTLKTISFERVFFFFEDHSFEEFNAILRTLLVGDTFLGLSVIILNNIH